MSALVVSRIEPAEPLHKRVPSHDEHGRTLTDFMILLPGLRDRPPASIEELVTRIQLVFAHHADNIRFAELNIRLNLLWVSVKPVTGIRFEIATALRSIFPDARLVCHI